MLISCSFVTSASLRRTGPGAQDTVCKSLSGNSPAISSTNRTLSTETQLSCTGVYNKKAGVHPASLTHVLHSRTLLLYQKPCFLHVTSYGDNRAARESERPGAVSVCARAHRFSKKSCDPFLFAQYSSTNERPVREHNQGGIVDAAQNSAR